MPYLLVGDIGGTSTRFGIADKAARVPQATAKLDNDEYTHFEDAMAAYLETCPHTPTHALLAVAGPVGGRAVQMTNRDWHIAADALQARFAFRSVSLVNDFAAMARAVPELSPEHFTPVLAGKAEIDAPIIIAGPGTGLGMATLLPRVSDAGPPWRVLGGEGGHVSFAPRGDLEVEIANILRAEYGFVSCERIVSGMGLAPIHRAMCRVHGVAYTPMEPADMLAAAQAGDALSEQICRLRAAAVMGFAGDMVLTNGARGGAVLAGGVTARLLPWLQRDEATSRFLDRGPRADYMSTIPVRAMAGEFVPLVGAAALHADSEAEPA